MHVLTVLDHPCEDAFTAAAAQQFMSGAEAAGHTVELADLHAEGFDPIWRSEDQRAEGDNTALAVRKEQQRIERADAICLVFPLFWWGMPAMTKGWVDKVWSWGWAYDQLADPEVSLQRKRTGILLIPAGARSDEMEKDGYAAALETAWIKGTFGYFGFSPRRIEFLNGSTGSAPRREALLKRCFQVGHDLPEPTGS